jgi:hypothetical protein
MDCDFIPDGAGVKCLRCGFRYRKAIRKTCSIASSVVTTEMRTNATPKTTCRTSPPSLLTKAANFTVAAIGHAMKGNPTCSQEQIDERLEICQACEFFASNSCQKCGCSVSRDAKYLNKLAWADQECPVGKWQAVSNPK